MAVLTNTLPDFEEFTGRGITRWPSVGLMLVQRRRRWTNIKLTLGQSLVLGGCHQTLVTSFYMELSFTSADTNGFSQLWQFVCNVLYLRGLLIAMIN